MALYLEHAGFFAGHVSQAALSSPVLGTYLLDLQLRTVPPDDRVARLRWMSGVAAHDVLDSQLLELALRGPENTVYWRELLPPECGELGARFRFGLGQLFARHEISAAVVNRLGEQLLADGYFSYARRSTAQLTGSELRLVSEGIAGQQLAVAVSRVRQLLPGLRVSLCGALLTRCRQLD